MSKYVYTAIVSNEYNGGNIWVLNFCGLRGCWVEGNSKSEVTEKAPQVLREYLKYFIENNLSLPSPMDVEELRQANIGEVVKITCEL